MRRRRVRTGAWLPAACGREGSIVAATLSRGTAFDGVRHDPAFQTCWPRRKRAARKALFAFREAGGEQLLGR